jgi:two-component system nitrogen regulation sensor histidine kinase GlnL
MSTALAMGVSAGVISLDQLPFAAWITDNENHWHASNEAALHAREALLRSPRLSHAIAQSITHEDAVILRSISIDGIGEATIWIQPQDSTALVLCDLPRAHAHQDALDESTTLSAHMVASLAHEIRNPLLSIRGAAQLLAATVSTSDKPLAALIEQETKRIDALMRTLDPLSDAPAPEMETLNIHELLAYVRVAAEASFARHVTFVQDYDPSLPPLYGHRERLIQMLMNLIKNAAEACEASAHPIVTFRTRYAFGEQRQRTGGAPLPIHLRIVDNGPGIDETAKAQLFTPFATTKPEGKGLGLPLVAAIMKQHHGLLAWESSEAGTQFDLYFAQAK